MDKYEYKLKLDELRELFQLKNYRGAAEVADEINWKKVRNSKTLCMVADVYEAVERYDACQEVLMQAYDHSSVGRNIVSRLTDIAIKSKDVPSAEEYYNEFLELAPNDTQRYVFAYKIACLKNAPLADRIAILEEFKEKEYSEMWAYELAVLYAQAGMREKCVETCDELILWFGDGEYVERALDLKRSFQPLTASQEEKYQRLRSQRGMVEINIPKRTEGTGILGMAGAAADGISPELKVTATKFNTQNLQEEIARSMQQIEEATEENTVRDRMNSIRKIVQDIPYLEEEEEVVNFQRREIQQKVSQELRSDFQEKLVEETAYGQAAAQSRSGGFPEDTSGMSIEEILADWEKTKILAQEAMAAAEQRKLDLEKEQALAEASAIMRRLEELVPILSATPGEDLPDSSEGTVADELLSAEPIVIKAKGSEFTQAAENGQLSDVPAGESSGTLTEEEAATSPLQQVFTRTARRQGRNPQDPMANVESLEDWSEEETAAGEAPAKPYKNEKAVAADINSASAELSAAVAAAANLKAAVASAAASAEEALAAAEIHEVTADDLKGTEEELIETEFVMPGEEALAAAAAEETVEAETAEAEAAPEIYDDELIEVEISAPAAEETAEAVTEEAVTAEAMAAKAEGIPEIYDEELIEVEISAPSAEETADAVATEAETAEAESAPEIYDELIEAEIPAPAAEETIAEEAVIVEEETIVKEDAITVEETIAVAEEAAKPEPAPAAAPEAEEDFYDEDEFFDTDEPTAEIDTDQITAFLMAQTEVLTEEAEEQAVAPEPPKNTDIMTDEIRGLFSYFIPIPGMSEQISHALGNVVNVKSDAVTSSRGNVIIQGEEGSGKTMLATDLVKAAQKVMGREADKIGKISAQALNNKNFSSLIPKIAGGYLIIEDAGKLSAETEATMSQVMEHDTNGMTLILEDDSVGIRSVMAQNPAFAAKFTEKIRIPIFTIDELVDFGKAYALEQECEIEEMAVLALYNRINNIQKLDRPTTLTEVKEIVDDAIKNAESGGIKKLFAKKYNDNDFLILHEEDFEV